jgi:hypothetical protein
MSRQLILKFQSQQSDHKVVTASRAAGEQPMPRHGGGQTALAGGWSKAEIGAIMVVAVLIVCSGFRLGLLVGGGVSSIANARPAPRPVPRTHSTEP